MPPATPDETLLTRYLLGTLPAAEAERLDERSVADEGFARQLETAEYDLVDRYVDGALAPGEMERFAAHYLATPRGARKVQFARSLRRYQQPAHTKRSQRFDGRGWPLAAAAMLTLAVAGLWVLRPPDEGGPPPVAPPDSAVASAPESPSLMPQPAPVVVAFTLSPARRGIAQPPDVVLRPETSEVTLRLELEGDEFPRYKATLKEAATGRTVHETPPLESSAFRNTRIVSVTVSASSLPATHYVAELEGLAPGQPGEPLSSYPFRVITAR